MVMAQQRAVKGWFTTNGRPGDRTLKEQLVGLDDLRERVVDKTVLDVGCAEGLISMQLFDEGARAVHGIEIVPGHVEIANKLRAERACTFEVADANHYTPVRQYDIVIMLAILQKLRDPSKACRTFAAAAREMVVLRLPPANAPTVIDARSGGYLHRIGDVMTSSGFMLKNAQLGHLGEWVGYYERVS